MKEWKTWQHLRHLSKGELAGPGDLWWPPDIRCKEGKEEAEGEVKAENLESFLDGGAESKKWLVERISDRCKSEGMGVQRKAKELGLFRPGGSSSRMRVEQGSRGVLISL